MTHTMHAVYANELAAAHYVNENKKCKLSRHIKLLLHGFLCQLHNSGLLHPAASLAVINYIV